jgi:hypothetical protein
LCFEHECTISWYQSCEATILHNLTQNDLWMCFRGFCQPSTGEKMQNLCLGLNGLFRGTEVVKHPLYSIGPKMMFGSVSVYFASLRHGIRCKTCFTGLSALFLESKVVTHPFYSIGPKMMFRSVSVHFANLQHVKVAKLVFEPKCTISWYRSCETSILVHWTQNDAWERFRAFH